MARVLVALAAVACAAAVAVARTHLGPVPLPANVLAPQRTIAFDAMKLKAIQPDFYNASFIATYNAGGVAADFVWADWEPALVLAPCPNPVAQVEYDGHCFTVQTQIDSVVSAYSVLHHMNVHANVYGSPAWAATDPNCQPATPAGAIFCAPDNASDYARFAGFIAWRYGVLPNATGSTGYINSFAVWNEVNTNAYFNTGCGSQGGAVPPCDVTDWVAAYADLWSAAYDSITSENPNAMVEACFDHSFEEGFDKPTAAQPTISVKTFVTTLIPQIGDRVLRIAYHPYTTDRKTPTFTPDDFPYVTYGNLGALNGWLIAQWPERTELWNEISLTESGINSAAPDSSNGAQANGVCQSFWNAIGTPGIVNYVYHRMVDDASEDGDGLLMGLVDETGNLKTSWSVWSQCNYQRFSCGFGNLPNTKLQRSKSATRNHWVSTRLPPASYTFEKAWFLYRDPQFNATTGEPQTVPIFECLVGAIGGGGGNVLSFSPNCEPPTAAVPLGLVGYAYTPANSNAQKFLVPLYRCQTTATPSDHFVSGDSACEGQTVEALLGYVLPAGF